MLFEYWGVVPTEAEIAKAAGASKEKGATMAGLIKAARYFGFRTFSKKNSTLNDLRHFIKKRVPVLVDWFLEDDGHYSIVIAIDKQNIVLMDPTLKGKRKMSLQKFLRIWFDFPGDYLKNKEELILRAMLVVMPKK